MALRRRAPRLDSARGERFYVIEPCVYVARLCHVVVAVEFDQPNVRRGSCRGPAAPKRHASCATLPIRAWMVGPGDRRAAAGEFGLVGCLTTTSSSSANPDIIV